MTFLVLFLVSVRNKILIIEIVRCADASVTLLGEPKIEVDNNRSKKITQ